MIRRLLTQKEKLGQVLSLNDTCRPLTNLEMS